jgi:hypothetical protein
VSDPDWRETIAGLPGADLIVAGLADLQNGRLTRASLLVAVAGSRLHQLGLPVPSFVPGSSACELTLYRLLCEEGDADPYSRYGALLRELASFVHALERRVFSRQSNG